MDEDSELFRKLKHLKSEASVDYYSPIRSGRKFSSQCELTLNLKLNYSVSTSSSEITSEQNLTIVRNDYISNKLFSNFKAIQNV
ncbi:unnamed protein product [Heterobilharzia americana]|nr:unnamed protein product [Heterobilharzia americana]CAH8551065.1 unnamed protein product [Heterobilharzia americana]